MKNKKIVIIFLFIFMLVSLVMITHARFRTEIKKQSREIRHTGRSLVKLVSLAYGINLEKADKNYFFRIFNSLDFGVFMLDIRDTVFFINDYFLTLLGNAVKYTPAFGWVSFSIRDNADAVVFEIEDTGVGIDPRDLPHVFEKFYRSENDAVAEQTGSGLGLAIAAEIVKKHNGSIEVKSQLSQGSTFIVTLPKGDLQIG